jgi:hypothetical protein
MLTLFLLTQTKAQNIPLYLLFRIQYFLLCKPSPCSLLQFFSVSTTQRTANNTSATHPHSISNHPNHSSAEPNILLRPRPQQQYLQHRPVKCLQRRKRVQHPRRRTPPVRLELGRAGVLGCRGCMSARPLRLDWCGEQRLGEERY